MQADVFTHKIIFKKRCAEEIMSDERKVTGRQEGQGDLERASHRPLHPPAPPRLIAHSQ